MNPEAENIQNLHPDYYPEQIKGKSKAYIDVYILNEYGATHDGRAVHREFSKDTHVAEPLTPWPGVPLIIDADFGLTPALTFSQKMRGRYQTLKEIVLTDGSAVELAKAGEPRCSNRVPRFKVARGWGDPSGDIRSQADKNTPFRSCAPRSCRCARLNQRPRDPPRRDARGAHPHGRRASPPGRSTRAARC
jgi:hypothetical protein